MPPLLSANAATLVLLFCALVNEAQGLACPGQAYLKASREILKRRYSDHYGLHCLCPGGTQVSGAVGYEVPILHVAYDVATPLC